MIDLLADYVELGQVDLVNEPLQPVYDGGELQVYRILSELQQFKLQKKGSLFTFTLLYFHKIMELCSYFNSFGCRGLAGLTVSQVWNLEPAIQPLLLLLYIFITAICNYMCVL